MGITELAELVRAGLDADEQAARACVGVNALAGAKRGKPVPRWIASEGAGISDTENIPRVKFAWERERAHILRHDPATVLRDLAARRQLLDQALAWEHYEANDPWYSCPASTHHATAVGAAGPCDCGRDERVHAVLQTLATPYQEANHG